MSRRSKSKVSRKSLERNSVRPFSLEIFIIFSKILMTESTKFWVVWGLPSSVRHTTILLITFSISITVWGVISRFSKNLK